MDNYYELVNNHYGNMTDKEFSQEELRDVIGELINKGYLAYNATIDGMYTKEMLIYEHIDPINGKGNDMRAICLDNDIIHIGNVISLEDNRTFMAVTNSDWNDVYNKYRIRQLEDDIKFTKDKEINMKCSIANKGFYNESSYINEAKVFEDEDMRAIIVQYNEDTSKLKLFDDVYVNDIHYKIIKVDNYTSKNHDEDYGVIQLVVIRTVFGNIDHKGKMIDGLLKIAKVKDRVFNSKSKQLYTNHGILSTGDYVNHTFDNGAEPETRTYLVYSEIDVTNEYDTAFCIMCDKDINLVDDDGNIVNYRLYTNDNKVKLTESNIGFTEGKDSSYVWASLRLDSLTIKLGETINRVLIKQTLVDGKEAVKAYKVIAKDDLSIGGIITISLEKDNIDYNRDDLVNGIAYNERVENPKPIEPIIISGNDKYRMGLNLSYTINNAGNLPCIWSSDKSYVIISEETNTSCKIKIVKDMNLLNSYFELMATVNGNEYIKKIKITG